MERYYYSIASGSSGNCGLYLAGDTAILIDLGVSLRKITTALAEIGLALGDLSAVLLTHDHIDHVKGLPMFLKKGSAPVFASRETARALTDKDPSCGGRLTAFDGGDGFSVGPVTVTAFETPHDAPGSVGYILEHGGRRFGFATDLGFVPRGVADKLCGCEAVVLESNHDPHMLQAGPYPYPLKMRVAGPDGHLSNPDCAVCAAELVKNGAKTLILAHLSEKNNMPELALQQTRSAVRGLAPCRIIVAPKERMEAPVLLGEEEVCSLLG
ncbi:MAG: MBL fold metallo-hydrolase [Eubacteriales bacterium]|nr:MBL fold metallo-hydrolase [Eubacteriales bacterium]